MKKLLSCLLLLLLVSTNLWVCAEFKNPSITDEAGCLMQSELKFLTEKLDKVREEYNFEVAIYTESDMTSYTAQDSADDIYDYLDYGYGENDDGIMLYICSDTREHHFTTRGKGIKYFNDRGLVYLESKVVPHLEENDYYEAFEAYIEAAEELLIMAEEGTPYNESHRSAEEVLGIVLVCAIVPLIIAFVMMRGKLKKMKTAVSDNYASNYIKPGSMNLKTSRDMFLFSRVVKTAKPKASSSGTHTSSSGRTHGGRGGSF